MSARRGRCACGRFALARGLRAGLLALALAGAAHAQTVVQGVRNDYPAGSSPSAVAVGDLDGDGTPDFAVTSYTGGTVSVRVGNGAGRFDIRLDFVVGTNPRSLAIGDVNGDGRPDMVVANQGSASISVLLGLGLGHFTLARNYATASNPRGVGLGDLNSDGLPDVVTANYFASSVSVLLNDGHAAFPARTDFATGSGPAAVAIGDVNGDGRPDVVVANSASNTVSVLLGDGAGGLAPRVNYPTGLSPVALALADVNGDGLLDVITADYLANTVTILLANGHGGFAPRTAFATGAGPTGVAVTDVDGDDVPDIVTSDGKAGATSLLHGDGAGGFGSRLDYATGLQPASVGLGDVNGDGRPDIVTANAAAGTATVQLGNDADAYGAPARFACGAGAISVAIGDLDYDHRLDLAVANYREDDVAVMHGDGHGSFAVSERLATGTGPLALAMGDLNQDGLPDLAVANAGSNTVSVLLDDGYGGFAGRVDYPTLLLPSGIAIGNLLGDVLPDLAVANQGSDTVSVLVGLGAGTFGRQTLWGASGSPRALAMGDVNTDGRPDLVVANWNSSSLGVLLNFGGVGFGLMTELGVNGLNPSALVLADVNNDHYLDAVVTNYGSNAVAVMFGNGTGGFPTRTSFPVGRGPRAVTVLDVNADRKLDLVVANSGDSTVSVLLGDGTGGFSAAAGFATGTGPWSVAAADLNGDGGIDFVTANQADGTVSVLLRRVLTATALAVAPEPSVLGQGVTLTATVALVDGADVPTGTVAFFDGTTLLGRAPLVGGVATFATPALQAGARTLTASYDGDTRRRRSTSSPVVHRVYRCARGLSAAASLVTAFEGDSIRIQCAGLPGASAIRFGGVPAPSFSAQPNGFAVDSARVLLRTVVPVGALSGPVRVECPCGEVATAGMLEVRRTVHLANLPTRSFGHLAGMGWPIARWLGDTLGTPLADLGLRGREDYDWRVRTWDPGTKRYVPATRLLPGRGYWIQTRAPWTAFLTGAAPTDTTLVLPLVRRGWQQFGNPFTTPVPVASLAVLKHGVSRPFIGQTDVQNTVFVWDPVAQRNVGAQEIPAGAMFWIQRLSVSTAESLLVPAPSAIAITPVAAALPGPDWSVRLAVREGLERSPDVTLGVAPLVAGQAHALTALAPPASPEPSLGLALAGTRAGELAEPYACLIADRSQAHVWELAIENAQVPGELVLEVTGGGLPDSLRLEVRDPANGLAAELAAGRPLVLAAVASQRRLQVEALPRRVPAGAPTVESVRAYPSPFGVATGFRFRLAAPADLAVSIYDIAGRQVRTIERRAAPAGEPVLVWDGTDARGEPVGAAVYFARCAFGSRRELLRVVRVR